MKIYTAEPAADRAYRLGEGPLWDSARERLLWIDSEVGAVFEGRLQGRQVETTAEHAVDATVGAVVCSAEGELLVAGAETLISVGVDGTRTEVARVLPAGGASRLNDGAVDPQGRFVVGGMSNDEKTPGNVLVRLESDGSITRFDDDLVLSNGLDWNADGTRFVSVESVPGVVYVRDYGPGRPVGERRELFRVTDGTPDGCCFDAAGNLWVAIWGRGQVRCYDSLGEVLAVVEVPAPDTTSIAFVGRDRDLMLITSAVSDGHPGSGRIFTAEVDAAGPALPYWRGR